jgi:outer membrane protein TolC
MKKQLFIWYFGVASATLFGQSAERIPITRATVLAKVVEQNKAIQIAEQDYIGARAELSQSNAIILPTLSVSHSAMVTTNPLMAFGSKLNQEVLTASDFNPALLNDPSQIQNYATNITLEQPLINVDGFYQRQAAKLQMQATKLQWDRSIEYIYLETNKAYMQLQLAHKAVAVMQQAVATAEANKNVAQDNVKAGYMQQADFLSVEIQVNQWKDQLSAAESNLENASDYLGYIINEPSTAVYVPSDSLSIQLAETSSEKLSENRSDVRAMQMASVAYEKMHQSSKMSFLPRLNAFGSYQLYDDQIFSAGADGYLLGAQLSWTIFEGAKRFGKVKQSGATSKKASLEYQQYIAKSQLELNHARRELSDAENRFETAKLAKQQAKEVLRIRSNRFKEGLEKTSDLLQAENQYAQKQLAYYQSMFTYNMAQSTLTFLTKD